MTITLYMYRPSGPSRAVLMTAKQLNLKVDVKIVDLGEGEQLKPEYLKVNPQHTVPTINDNGFILWESKAIVQYLCNKYEPDSTLYPRDPKKRAIVERWIDFSVALATAQMEGVAIKMMTGVDPPEDKVNAFKDKLRLADQWIGPNQYLTGNLLTIADLYLLAFTCFLVDLFNYDLTEFPNFKRWILNLKSELPYYAEVNQFEDGYFEGLSKKMAAKYAPKT